MQHWLSHLRIWFYQGWQLIDTIKPGTDEETFWGLLKILGFLGVAIVAVVVFSRRSSHDIT